MAKEREEGGAPRAADAGTEVTGAVSMFDYKACEEALGKAEEVLALVGGLPDAPEELVALGPSSGDAVRTRLAGMASGSPLVGAAVLSEALVVAESALDYAEERRDMALHAALETSRKLELRSAELRATVFAGRRRLFAVLAGRL